ncbi:MAG: putative ABC transporter ATP-binding protein [Candidatus Izimaplasma bacterium HR2]|nr:MAG: putative ABC transporter ATP-binding protein [Candidatus Izimaplasma bacterium HR2]
MGNLNRLLKYTGKYYQNIIVSLTAMLVQVWAGFKIPLLMKDIIDEAIPNKDYDDLLRTTILMVAVALFGLGAGLLNNYNSQKVSQFASADLRLDLFKKIQSLSFTNIDKFKTSRLITSSTNDIVRIQQFYQMLLRIIVRAPLMIGFGLFMAISLNKDLSNIFYVSMPILVIAIIIIMIIAFPKFTKVQKTVDELNKTVLETANAPRVIKSFVSIKHENDKFEAANELFRKTNTAAEKVMTFADPIIMFIFNASLAGLIYLSAYYLDLGTFPLMTNDSGDLIPKVGEIIAFSNFSMQILFGLMMFAMMMIFISRASVSAKRIMEIFNEEVDLTNKDNALKDITITGNIEFRNVSFNYGEEGLNVLEKINFKIKSGETIGIIGSTGSGKTSLINLIPRLYDVSDGSVSLDGEDVRNFDLETLRSQISVVTQTATVFSGSIGTNIAQGKKDADMADYKEAAKNASALGFIEDYDDFFNHQIQQKGSNLSGGEKQRLSLSRAFIRKPKILILDDSTSAVDAKSEESILKAINKLSKNMTTLVISQKISTIKDMDKIIVLDTLGRLDGFNSHEELLKTSKVYAEIALSQVGNGGDFDE